MVNIKKINGGMSPYMLGLVAGVGIVSTLAANQAKLQNEDYQKKYIEEKKQHLNDLNDSIANSIITEEGTSSSVVSASNTKTYSYSNIFSSNGVTSLKQGTQSDGEKITTLSLESNEYKNNQLLNVSNSNALKTDYTPDVTEVFNEKSIRDIQISKSYENMKKQAYLMYDDIEDAAEKKWPCAISMTKSDAWGRDFTYTRVDDAYAQISFNLPWDNTTSKVLNLKLPELPVELDEIISIHKDRNSEYTALLTKNGKVFASGDGRNYLMGSGSSVDKLSWVELTNLSNIVRLEFSAEFSQGMALDGAGRLFVVGQNSRGQLGLGNTSSGRVWTETASNVEEFYAFTNDFTYIKKKDGTVWGTGRNVTTSGGGYSQLGLGSDATANYLTWVQIPELTGMDKLIYHHYISATSHDYYAKMNDGRVFALGYNNVGQFNTGDSLPVSVWTDTGMTDAKEVQMSITGRVVLVLKNDGSLWGNGSNSGIFNNGTTTNETSWTEITTGVNRFLLMGYGDVLYIEKTDGSIHTIGDSANGQLGNGTTTSTDTRAFSDIGLSNVKEFYSNTYASSVYVLTNDGKIKVAGANSNGSIGAGATTKQSTFLEVLDNVKEIQVHKGYGGITALKNDGTVWVTGNNSQGQLGGGASTSYTTFTQVPELSSIDKLMEINHDGTAVKNYYVIDTDGAIWSTGNNTQGQLGIGSKVNQNTFSKSITKADLGGSGGTVCP